LAAAVAYAELYGLNTTNNGKIVVFGGGIPLVKAGKVISGVGVRGCTVPNDIKVALAAVFVFEGQESLVFSSDS
jgi:uncharacterized protein GlcG (DUF336 family)